MKVVIQIIPYSVIGGLAMNCRDDGSVTLSNCSSNPNIRIEKIRDGNHIKHYRLSLHSQNTWWNAETEKLKWIECKDLCEVCQSLPGNNKDGENTSN